MIYSFDVNKIPLDWRDIKIPKKSGGWRQLHVPNDDLKEAQKEVLDGLYQLWLQDKIKISAVAHGFVPTRDILTAVTRHDLQSKVVICVDVKGFFDNFPTWATREKLLLAKPSYEVDVDMKLCTYNNTFPQGSPASPFLTNIGMFDVDCQLAAYSKKHGFLYTRYADDMQFSLIPGSEQEIKFLTDDKARKAGNTDKYPSFYQFIIGVETILKKELGLILSKDKTHIIYRMARCKPQVLGVILRQDMQGYNAPMRTRQKARAAVHNLWKRITEHHGVVFPEDWITWPRVKGLVGFLNNCRKCSLPGADTPDPRINFREYNYLKEKFNEQLLPQEL